MPATGELTKAGRIPQILLRVYQAHTCASFNRVCVASC